MLRVGDYVILKEERINGYALAVQPWLKNRKLKVIKIEGNSVYYFITDGANNNAERQSYSEVHQLFSFPNRRIIICVPAEE